MSPSLSPPPGQTHPLDPIVFRPDSPLTDVDVEEVDGPLPSVTDNILPRPRGFRVRPEEHQDHPQFQQYGRRNGHSQRARKPVNKAYTAPATFAEFAQQLQEPGDDEDAEIPPSEDLEALLAGFGRQTNSMNYKEAMSSSRKIEVVAAPGKEPIKTTWNIVEKFDADGNRVKVKARVVVQGFRQQEGRDYKETHTAVPRTSTVRLFNAFLAKYGRRNLCPSSRRHSHSSRQSPSALESAIRPEASWDGFHRVPQ